MKARLAALAALGIVAAASWARGARAQDEANVLTIENAVEMARGHHPQVAHQRAEVAQARALKEQAAAGYLPSLTGEFTFAPQTPNYSAAPGFQRVLDARTAAGVDSVVDTAGNRVLVNCVPPVTPGGQVDGTACHPAPSYVPSPIYSVYQYWNASVGVAWVPFDWGKTYFADRSAAAAVTAEEMALGRTTSQIALDAKLAYYDVLNAEAAANVAEEETATRRRHLDTAQGLHDAGRNTKIDVASAESSLAAAELALVRARAAITVARGSLAAAIGDDSMHGYKLVMPVLPNDDSGPTDAEVAAASERRPELREMAMRAASARDGVRSARGSYLPQLQIQAGPWWSGSALDRLVTNYGASVSITYPGAYGMNPWLIHGKTDEAAAMSDAFDAEERRLHNVVRLEAEQARTELRSARKAVLAAGEFVRAARERRDQAEARYREGVGTYLELSDAEVEFTSARFEEVRSTFDVGRAQSRLERAMAAR